MKPRLKSKWTMKRPWIKSTMKGYLSKGIAEGETKGKAEGLIEGKIETARMMLAEGLEVNLISKITKLSIAEITNLKLSS